MARRFSGPRFRRRGGRGSRNRPRWTALVDSYTLAAGAVDESIIVAPADYRTATSLENEATFIRLRASLQLANLSATLPSTVVIACMKMQEGLSAASFDPSNQANLQNGDILWTAICGLQPLATTSHLSNQGFYDIDIKSKRKLQALPEGEKITMAVSNVVGGGSISVLFIGRALLTLNL